MRSLLFVPADSEKKMARALESGADAIILDLEDSVAEAGKPAARKLARAFTESAPKDGPAIVIRVNPIDGPFYGSDIEVVAAASPLAVMLPKATAKGADALARDLSVLGNETARILTVATETPAALFQMDDYANCPANTSGRLLGLSWGAEDLAAEVGATSNRRADGEYTDTFRLARTLTLLAARAAGVLAIDGVYTDFRNETGLRETLSCAVRDGFDAMLAIHPAQVPVINEVLTPSADEIAHAQAIVDAFAAQPEAGVLSIDGKMIDLPHLKQARRVLARAGL